MKNTELESKLLVGTKIKIGKQYSKDYGFNEGEIITLIQGHFEYYNGLYSEDQTAPSVKGNGDAMQAHGQIGQIQNGGSIFSAKVIYTMDSNFKVIDSTVLSQPKEDKSIFYCDVFIKGDSMTIVKSKPDAIWSLFGDSEDWIKSNRKNGYKYFISYQVYTWSNGNGDQPYDWYMDYNSGDSYKSKIDFRKEVEISMKRHLKNLNDWRTDHMKVSNK